MPHDYDDSPQFEDTLDKISNAISTHVSRTRVAANIPRIFVSHRHVDELVARGLVECLMERFAIEPHDIRCTSVHPFRLKAGEDTERKLKEEVVHAEVSCWTISASVSVRGEPQGTWKSL